MKIDEKGNLVQEGYDSSFSYKGRLFVIDKLDDGYLATESQFIIKERGDTLEEVIENTKKYWDKVEHKYKDF